MWKVKKVICLNIWNNTCWFNKFKWIKGSKKQNHQLNF